jgi:hypothetical protein
VRSGCPTPPSASWRDGDVRRGREPGARPRRRLRRRGAGPLHRGDGPVRVRQVDAHARQRGARHGHSRLCPARGTDLTTLEDKELTAVRRDRIGWCPAVQPAAHAHRRGEHRAARTARRRRPDPERLPRVVEVLGLESRLRHRPSELSGGQQQRVAVARALVAQPDVVFADEPTGNLDSRPGADVLAFLRSCVDTLGQTLVMVTQDPVAWVRHSRRDHRPPHEAAPRSRFPARGACPPRPAGAPRGWRSRSGSCCSSSCDPGVAGKRRTRLTPPVSATRPSHLHA